MMSGLELPHNIGDIIGARNVSKQVIAKVTLKILFVLLSQTWVCQD